MIARFLTEGVEKNLISALMRVPWLNLTVRTRGWPYVLTWSHRISGLLLVLYLWLHIYTLSSLPTPEVFAARMNVFRFFVFILLEWLLAIPVIFHALNGARLILYESFGNRNELTAIRWVCFLSMAYTLLLGLMMLIGNQTVTPFFFWLSALLLGACLCYAVANRIWQAPNSAFWKIQRVSGSFLLIMIPAHLLFMHLNPAVGHDAVQIVARMKTGLVKTVDLLLIFGSLYHGGYGIISFAKDYLPSRPLQAAVGVAVSLLMIFFAGWGIRLLFSV